MFVLRQSPDNKQLIICGEGTTLGWIPPFPLTGDAEHDEAVFEAADEAVSLINAAKDMARCKHDEMIRLQANDQRLRELAKQGERNEAVARGKLIEAQAEIERLRNLLLKEQQRLRTSLSAESKKTEALEAENAGLRRALRTKRPRRNSSDAAVKRTAYSRPDSIAVHLL